MNRQLGFPGIRSQDRAVAVGQAGPRRVLGVDLGERLVFQRGPQLVGAFGQPALVDQKRVGEEPQTLLFLAQSGRARFSNRFWRRLGAPPDAAQNGSHLGRATVP